MVAVKSAVVATVLASVKVPTTMPASGDAGVFGVQQGGAPAVSAASAMTAVPETMVTEPPSSVTVTV